MFKKKTVKKINLIALWLITIGAINLGTNIFLKFNIIDTITKSTLPIVGDLIQYSIVLSGVWVIYLLLTKQLR